MCGLAGYQGLSVDEKQRLALVLGLGDGIDTRGGDAAGYVAITRHGFLDVDRLVGTWSKSWRMTMTAASIGEHSLAMHARYATCGTKTVIDAHPFTIRREGKVVLHGMHNGVIWDARSSAEINGRGKEYSVDSRELFELLADGETRAIADLNGYGTIVWIEPSAPHEIKLARLTADADLSIATVDGGGVVWASTRRILQSACEFADVPILEYYEVDDGVVHTIRDGLLYVAPEDRLSLGGFGRTRRWTWEPEPEDQLVASELEEEELRWQLCHDYGLNPDHVEGMTSDEIERMVAGWK